MKKSFFKLLALAVITFLVSGCNLIKVVDASSIATVNGEKILTSEYMYYLAVAKMQLQQTAASAASTEDFWNTTEIEGKKAGDVAKERALDDAINATIIAQKAKEEGFSADSPEAKSQISQAMAQLAPAAEQYGFTADGLNLAYQKAYLRTKLFDKYVEDGKITVTEDALKVYYAENYRTVKHILIQTTDPQSGNVYRSDEQALAEANDIIAKLAAGNDFDAAVTELSEDPGSKSNPDGYTFAHNGMMVPEFEDAAFKLQENEVSAPVKTSYGYHILKRYPLISYDDYIAANDVSSIENAIKTEAEDTLVDEWKASAKIENDTKKYDSIKIKD